MKELQTKGKVYSPMAGDPSEDVATISGRSLVEGGWTPASNEAPGEVSDLPRPWRLLLVLAVFAAVYVAVEVGPLGDALHDVRSLKEAFRGTGTAGIAAFGTLAALLVALGCPRLLICAAAGFLYGFVVGFALSQAATVLGAYGAFLLARWAGRDWVEARLARRGFSRTKLRVPGGLLGVFLLRQVPVGGVFINLALGLSAVRHGTFLAGTFLGFLPQGVAVTLLASGIGKHGAPAAHYQVLLGALCLVLSWTAVRKLLERRKTWNTACNSKKEATRRSITDEAPLEV